MIAQQTISDNLTVNAKPINFELCIKVGNYLTSSALFIMTICILISFAFDQHISLTTQIFSHIGTIIFAALVKIGYVIRCVGAHGLGHKAF